MGSKHQAMLLTLVWAPPHRIPHQREPSVRLFPSLSATAAKESAGRDGQFPPGAIIAQAQMRLWLVYISQGTVFVFPFSSFTNKKKKTNPKLEV